MYNRKAHPYDHRPFAPIPYLSCTRSGQFASFKVSRNRRHSSGRTIFQDRESRNNHLNHAFVLDATEYTDGTNLVNSVNAREYSLAQDQQEHCTLFSIIRLLFFSTFTNLTLSSSGFQVYYRRRYIGTLSFCRRNFLHMVHIGRAAQELERQSWPKWLALAVRRINHFILVFFGGRVGN